MAEGLGELDLRNSFSVRNLAGEVPGAAGDFIWDNRGHIAGAVVGVGIGTLTTHGSVFAQDGGPGTNGEGIFGFLGSAASSVAEFAVNNPLKFYAAATTLGGLWGAGQAGYWLATRGGGEAAKFAAKAKDGVLASVRKDQAPKVVPTEAEKNFILAGVSLAETLGLIDGDTPDEVSEKFQQMFFNLQRVTTPKPKKEVTKFSDDLKERLGIIPKEMGQWLAAAVMFDLGMRGLSPELSQGTTATMTELALAGWIRQITIAAFIVRAVLPENINIRFELGRGQKK